MTYVVSFCSSRGGTGKTTIATNLAFSLALSGVDTVAIDMDFRAPSFFHVFKNSAGKPAKQYVNEFLDSRCQPQDVLFDLGDKFGTKGKLMIGSANPSISAIEEMSAKSRNWEAKALRNLFQLKKSVERDLNNPIIIYDNGPGVHYSSLNTIVSSDIVVFVSTPDSLDLQGLANLFREYEDLFEDKAKIVLNKVFPIREQWSEHTKDRFMNRLPEILRKLVIAVIPCYCDFLDPEKQTLVSSEHPLNTELAEIAGQLGLANARLG